MFNATAFFIISLRSCLKLINGIAFKTKDAHRYTDEVIATQQWRHKKPMLVP